MGFANNHPAEAGLMTPNQSRISARRLGAFLYCQLAIGNCRLEDTEEANLKSSQLAM
jgi:hypothetical protein